MNSTKQVVLVAVAATALFLGSNGLQAQLTPTAEAGLIGQRYAGFDFTYDRYNSDAIGYTFGADATGNLPLNDKLDLSFGYDLSHTNDSDHGLNHNTLHATLLTYQRNEYGNAYFAGTLGQRWDRVKTFGVVAQDNDAFWALATGYEIPVGAVTAINLGFTYRDAFRGNRTTQQYRAEANHWFSSGFAGVVSASYNQIKKVPDTLLLTVGVRWALR